MDDFGLPGPLTDVTVAIALLSYFAAAVLLIGLAIQTFRLLGQIRRNPPEMGSGSTLRKLFRAATDIVLLRDSFFADRWAWIFGLMFHFGLVLILIRHLRYFVEPSWVGPLWQLITLEQPFGLYGGLALPVGAGLWWLRQIVLKQGRIITSWADHAVMGLLIAIPVVGYANTIVHTDVVAVHTFGVGLITFHWRNLPFDPVLLVHLLLVAALLLLLPFSRLLLLLPFGKLLHIESAPRPDGRSKSTLAYGLALLCVMLVPILIIVDHGFSQGWTQPPVNLAKLPADHPGDEPNVMIRDHPAFLLSYRTAFVHSSTEIPFGNLEGCVTCHVTNDASNKPVGFDDPRHFCRSCHNTAAVSIDCFECHQSRPTPPGESARDNHGIGPRRLSALAIIPPIERSITR